jgi:hypothetical protein
MLSIGELGLLNLPFGLDRHIKLLGICRGKHIRNILFFKLIIDILKTILNGIALQPNLSRGWWILAKCLIEMGRYEWVIFLTFPLLHLLIPVLPPHSPFHQLLLTNLEGTCSYEQRAGRV